MQPSEINHAISYSFIQQGLTGTHNLDAFVGEVSGEGDEISGDAMDKRGKVGSFSFKRIEAKQES